MRIPLVLASLAALGLAADLSGPWDINLDENTPNSCYPWKANLQKAYDESAELVLAANSALDNVKDNARPDEGSITRSTFKKIVDWDRTARNMLVFFGWSPNQDGEGNSQNMQDVKYVISKMNGVFSGHTNSPAKGYLNKFNKPALACGDDGWELIKPDQDDPTKPGTLLKDSQPTFAQNGAWHWKGRLTWIPGASSAQSVGLCRPGVNGVTKVDLDLITFCGTLLDAPGARWVKDEKSTIAEGTKLDDFGIHAISRTIIHEFAHYYGFDGTFTANSRRVPDQQCVNANGDLLYRQTVNGRTTSTVNAKTNGQDNPPYLTYFFKCLQNLARTHTGANAGNTGPRRSIFTAEAYAYFAMASYLDNWDWSADGKAAKLPTSSSGSIPNKRDLSSVAVAFEA